jgi:SAM-dependent methyltransferase
MEQEAHDNWAIYYDYVYERTYGPAYSQFTDLTLSAIKDILGSKRSILDFGAGTGRLCIPLKQAGYEVTAIEKSLAMAEIIEQKAKNLNLSIDIHKCGIAEYQNGKADLAIAVFTVLSYATKEEQIEEIVLNIKKHLLPGGYFFFDLPNAKFFQNSGPTNIQKVDLNRSISLILDAGDIYLYSETCNGTYNNIPFAYHDEFQIRYWDLNFFEDLLTRHGFRDTNQNFSQFAGTGSTYRLFQVGA